MKIVARDPDSRTLAQRTGTRWARATRCGQVLKALAEISESRYLRRVIVCAVARHGSVCPASVLDS